MFLSIEKTSYLCHLTDSEYSEKKHKIYELTDMWICKKKYMVYPQLNKKELPTNQDGIKGPESVR